MVFSNTQPSVSVWVFIREEGIYWAMAFALGLGLMVAASLSDCFDQFSDPYLDKMQPYLIGGLVIAVVATGILIWLGSTWAPLSIAIAISFAVHAARAAGLEPKRKLPNLPHVEG